MPSLRQHRLAGDSRVNCSRLIRPKQVKDPVGSKNCAPNSKRREIRAFQRLQSLSSPPLDVTCRPPRAKLSSLRLARTPSPEVVKRQRFTKVRVFYGGSEVTNPLRTFFNGVKSKRATFRSGTLNFESNSVSDLINQVRGSLPPDGMLRPNRSALRKRWTVISDTWFRQVSRQQIERTLESPF